MKPSARSDAESCPAYQSVRLFLRTPNNYYSFHFSFQFRMKAL